MNNPDLNLAPESRTPATPAAPAPLYLRRSGTALLLDFRTGEPALLHFGADLGPELPDLSLLTDPVPHSALDVPVTLGLVPQASSGWRGRPGLRGHRGGTAFSPRLRLVSVDADPGDGASAVLTQTDPDVGITVRTELRLNDGGLLQLRHTLVNDGGSPYTVEELAAVLPVGRAAAEVLDLTGRWCRESHPQRLPLQQGTWVRSGRHGRTGHDASLLLAAGTPGFGYRHGQVWAVHLGWSGNHESFVDTTGDGRTVIGASELLGSAEVTLAPGESYETPWLFAAYSDEGLDGITAAFYAWFRARPHHPTAGKPRPVVLNVWEAVYFDHRLPALLDLAATAAALGVERYVLDDGWFRGRRNDTAGLGDWYVDEDLWPDGLTPLIDAVTGHGMEFGLWVEPEMVNEDSDLARAHPDWIAGPATGAAGGPASAGRLPERWRHQQVLDLVNPDAWQYIYDRLDALLSENRISYLKWDQNRDLTEMGHDGRPSVHAQTRAVYRLLDALREAHPDVEIESCSSGGARVDLGILERTDRVWGSDCNDALERQTIQRWTGMVVPPELVGSHIGPTRSHTTARTHDLSFRAVTAMFGHFGLEWDIRHLEPAERNELAGAIALFKEYRGLLHSGRMVRADEPDPALRLHGVVAHDGGEALFALVSVATSFAEIPGRVCLPGLDPDTRYRVEAVYPAATDRGAYLQTAPPGWLAGGVEATGRFLAGSGLPMPVLNPEHGVLLSVRRAGGGAPHSGTPVRNS
ncbi:alpha-galactosidase [Pseudarthrobacter sp. L19]|uniref:alpha-galactosidase n=1 Tax=Pseudarthrobacter sp. L19 TaxID=3423951 RepID=UPI003D7A4BFD